MLRLSDCWFVLVCFLFFSVSTFGQVDPGYYLFPIKPGERNFLAGTMAEIRPNHFHSGVDIKTEGREGLPIHAAADGHVHRIKISTQGYGNVLYLKHPNGQYTVYAHLRELNASIGQYMREKMYNARINEMEYFLEPGELPVNKGDTIAYSGNTGSSMGPHLHFEIRDSLDRALDPLDFQFQEIIDSIPPYVQRIAITPLDINSRVNGMFQRREFPVVYYDNAYRVNQEIKITGKVGIEVLAYDQLNDMYNRNGFPTYKIVYDGKDFYESTAKPLDFSLGRFILSHTYRNRYTRLYKKPNNLFDFYQPDSTFSGAISLAPNEEKEVEVQLIDTYQNTRSLKLKLNGEDNYDLLRTYNSTSFNNMISYEDHIMIINENNHQLGDLAMFYVHGYQFEIPYEYQGTNKRTYLWDMRLGIPDSVGLCSGTIIPDVQTRVLFQDEVVFDNGEVQVAFASQSLLDDFYLRISPKRIAGDPGIRINEPFEYLRGHIEVSFCPEVIEAQKEHSHVYLRYENGFKRFKGGSWNGDCITFRTNQLGDFVVAQDSIGPTIRPMRVNSSELRFSIRDNLSGIRDFEAYVDGKWVLMRYEHKQAMIWSEKLENQPFEGEVLLKVRDMANNESIFRGKI
ncbi:M23 family metallopeptidase [Pleomorphovibrio marinus]|uniref:M23 family metallopeptidase n=1 Tax=Pleomorphovibrio marinus TaxID=2164132 RepID=UPI000E0B8542|nr:M23 family metallopeptidase [Pleomorphovibrio marinus]